MKKDIAKKETAKMTVSKTVIKRKRATKKIPNVSEPRYGMEEYHFQCECSAPEHSLCLTSTEDGDLYLSVFLVERSWWSRVWYGLKYIFGYKCRYGHFESISLRSDDAPRLIWLLENSEKAREATRQAEADKMAEMMLAQENIEKMEVPTKFMDKTP